MSPRLGHFNKEKSGKWAFFHSMQEATFIKIAWYSLRVVQNPNRLDQNTPKKPCTKWTGCKRYSTPHQGKETVIMTASPTGRQHRKEVKIAPYLTPQGKNSWIKCKTQNFLTLKKKMITASTLDIEGLFKTQSIDCKCYWWICLLKWGILNQKYHMVKPSKKVKSQVTNQEKLKCKLRPQ